jgi:hypothetical protein
LSTAASLTDPQREALRSVVRHWCVRYAAYRVSSLRYLQWAGIGLACALCLFGPAVAVGTVAASSLSPVELTLAGFLYLAVSGAVAALYFRLLFGPSWVARVGWLGVVTTTLGALIIAALWVPYPWPAVRFSLIAGGIALLVVIVGHTAGYWVGTRIWLPLRHRVLGAVAPSWIVAARLWYILDAFEDAARSWRVPETRRDLLAWVSQHYWLENAMPRAMWSAGYRRPAHLEAARRLRHATAFINSLAWRLADCTDHAEFGRIRHDLAEAAAAVAVGDWTLLLAHEPPPRRAAIQRISRRLIPAGSLASVALLLPYLPGLAFTDAQLTTMQAALLVGAVLTLSSVDQAARDPILDAFGDTPQRS